MENEKFHFSQLDFDNDSKQIFDWDKKYKNTTSYKNIKKYILKCLNAKDMQDFLYLIACEQILMDSAHTKEIILVAKNENEKIMGLIDLIGKNLNYLNSESLNTLFPNSINPKNKISPYVLIRYILTNPEFTHQGIGGKILEHTINHISKYFGEPISYLYADINVENTPSQGLFDKFDFSFTYNPKLIDSCRAVKKLGNNTDNLKERETDYEKI